MMKILFIGDIFGQGGRETVAKLLPSIIEEQKPDFVLANAENLTHGNGFTASHINEMQAAGIDFFTSGNHAWGQADGVQMLSNPDFPVIRPANFPDASTPGRGYAVVNKNGKKLLIVNLMGRVFMKLDLDCPFRMMDRILENFQDEELDGIFLDFHAEASSEKYALGFYLDGRISCMVGTHTHVQTHDARILPNGTAYITDVGMSGPYDSVIGIKKETIIERFLKQTPVKHEPEMEGQMILCGIVTELDSNNKKALTINYVKKTL